MAYQVLIHPLAEKEFIDAFLWYEERLPGLGLRFQEKNHIGFAFHHTSRNPKTKYRK